MDSDRRQSERQAVNSPASIRDDDGRLLATCMVCNLSEGGAKLQLEGNWDVPKEFCLVLGPMRNVGRRCQMIWRIGNKVGVRFPAASPPAAGAHKGSGVWAAE